MYIYIYICILCICHYLSCIFHLILAHFIAGHFISRHLPQHFRPGGPLSIGDYDIRTCLGKTVKNYLQNVDFGIIGKFAGISYLSIPNLHVSNVSMSLALLILTPHEAGR